MHSRFFSILAALVVFSAVVNGQQATRDPRKEQVIWKELAAVAPGALGTFQRGTVALDKADYPQAVRLYRAVVKQAPAFSPASRRLGFRWQHWGRPMMH